MNDYKLNRVKFKCYHFILFFILCFSVFSFAQQLNQKQIELIESLAFPLEEPMTFYRWEWNERIAKEMIKDGEMTPEYHQSLLEKDRAIAAGTGLYLAESLISSSQLDLSNALIEVEVEKGVRFLDIEAHIDKLRNAGINTEDIYALDMDNLLISDFRERVDDWHVFKGRTGVKFKPFSIQNASLADLFRARTLDFSSNDWNGKYPFNQIDFEGHVKKRVQQALAEPVKNTTDAMNLFALGEPHFSPKEREKALNLVLNNTNNMEDSLKLFKRWEYSRSKLKQTANPNRQVRNIMSLSDELVDRFYELLSPDEGERLFNHVLDRVSTVQDALNFIIYSDSQAGKKPKGKNNFFDDKYLKQIAEKVKDQPIRSLKEANSFLFRTRDLLPAEDLNKIIERTIPLIENVTDSIDLLNNKVISPTNKAKIYERIPSLTLRMEHAEKLLSLGVPIELENHIVSQMEHNTFGPRMMDEMSLLSRNLSEENQDKIITKILRHYYDLDTWAKFFKGVPDHISPTQKYRILDHLASLHRINEYELSQFKKTVSNTDFQYFIQLLQKRQPRLNCMETFLDIK